jgi:hypothetical protein
MSLISKAFDPDRVFSRDRLLQQFPFFWRDLAPEFDYVAKRISIMDFEEPGVEQERIYAVNFPPSPFISIKTSTDNNG